MKSTTKEQQMFTVTTLTDDRGQIVAGILTEQDGFAPTRHEAEAARIISDLEWQIGWTRSTRFIGNAAERIELTR